MKICQGYSFLAAFWPLKILAFDLGAGEIVPQLHFVGFLAMEFDVAITIKMKKYNGNVILVASQIKEQSRLQGC